MKTAWLVEIGSLPMYLEGISRFTFNFTHESTWALRFSRKIDADKLVNTLGFGKSIEHTWSD